MMNKTFEKICGMTQKQLKVYVSQELYKMYDNVHIGDGYVYAQGTFPVLLVAHLDTVHKKLPDPIFYDMVKGEYHSPNGIGGDDRCGVYMILQIIKKYDCSVLFCEDEESGCIGAKKFVQTDLAKELEFNYAIELDRRGKNDAVFYDCDNPEFEDFITKEFFETAYGSFTDICTVAPVIGCAAVNFSCGYYGAHTEKEYVVMSEMEKVIEETCKLLERTTEDDKFEYIESKYGGYGCYGYGWGGYSSSNYVYSGWEEYDGGSWKGNGFVYYNDDDDDYDDYYYYLIEFYDNNGKSQWFETFATSEAEAVGRCLMRHCDITYSQIGDVMRDKIQ